MQSFELSYGSDFVGIEFFFRGFLVLAFIRWAGKEAVLPMACFYCTIHFGKPLGECISSYFGGLLLGVVIANTRSVWGGLMVHLGIAWMMELGGYIGESLSHWKCNWPSHNFKNSNIQLSFPLACFVLSLQVAFWQYCYRPGYRFAHWREGKSGQHRAVHRWIAGLSF